MTGIWEGYTTRVADQNTGIWEGYTTRVADQMTGIWEGYNQSGECFFPDPYPACTKLWIWGQILQDYRV